MEKAIKKAIEGGWKKETALDLSTYNIEKMCLDPLFCKH